MTNGIISLNVDNFKRIKAVRIPLHGGVNVISGRNAQGKTSVIDALACALGGGAFKPEEPVRRGEKQAKIVVETTEFIVTKTIDPEGDVTLSVTSPAGARYPSPQAMLDKMFGKLAFDPLAFLRMDDAKQAETVKKLVGLDFSAIDQRRKAAFDNRTIVNRDVKALEARVSSAPSYADAPAQAESVDALAKELDERRKVNALKAAAVRELDAAKRDAQRIGENAASLETTIASMKKELAIAEQKLAMVKSSYDTQLASVVEMEKGIAAMPTANENEILEKMKTIDAVNGKVRANEEKAKLEAQLADAKKKAQEFSVTIDKIDAEKQAALSAAKFPVSGLGFDDKGLTFNSLPFTQASSAEQLKVSMAMALAMNPTIKLCLIRDGSLLDNDSLAVIQKMADEAGAQVLIEMVSNGEGVGVVIEDGAVKSIAASKEESTAPAAAGQGSLL